MDIKIAKEVIECLPQGKTAFHYYKDRYAAFILSEVIKKSCRVSDLKKSDYSGLLNKPVIKEIVARSGDGILRQDQLDLLWAESSEPFLLSLDTWGHGQRNWDQVSRSGHNLVLQLNFSNKHDTLFRKLVNPDHDNDDRDHGFRYFDHPVMKKGKRDLFRETLAWARIDFDFNTNEALIEELQTDWLRIARRKLKQIERGYGQHYLYGADTTPKKMKSYLKSILLTYGKIWDEAILMAAMKFIRQELGINIIYIHTPDTGAAVKKIKYRQPPRSLYTTLPRKFCFNQTDQAPEFLYQSRAFRKLEKKLGGTQWNYINLARVQVNLGGNYDKTDKDEIEKSRRDVTLVA